MYDRSWHRLSTDDDRAGVKTPATLADMIAGAEILGSTSDFVHVDLYDIDGAQRFGELTFYLGSGLAPFDPPQLDDSLGRCWLMPSNRLT
ncbi:ATP-grasp fold amidoligase family protein [Sphingomonas sp. BAUL-RG-20F-R05-02]|uniref:ATP-grasp fold amidoligase family protein n=1 Tax=Sphingomonas sp. BAUL-RG-20F-R05-02 TaxID=2914830 RepID=UPI00391F7334